MNITDQEIYHGIVCQKILKQLEDNGFKDGITFQSGTSKNSILIKLREENFFGVYIKYTKKNLSPWAFSFHYEHQEEIKILNELCSDVFVALVCGYDGVPLISYNELKELLDDNFEENERISITRKPRGNYWLKGRDGVLEKSVTVSDLGTKLSKNYIKK